MADDYPAAAFWLLLIGGILELIGYTSIGLLWGAAMVMGGPEAIGIMGMGLACIGWFVIMGILMIVSAMWVKSGDPDKVHKGGVMGLIASILGGFNILALIGAILALGWKKKTTAAPPPPPPPPA